MKSVKIIGKEVRVDIVGRDTIQGNSGLSNATLLRIWVAKDLPKEEAQDTMLHEIIHILDYSMDTELTETQVKRLATGLLAFFKDNPKYYERWVK
jgi:hypothetical protein